jgi:hypothetical protein
VELRFRPWSTIAGAGVSLLALAMIGVLGLRMRVRGDILSRGSRTKTLACVLAPWIAFGAVRTLSPDPHFPPPSPNNPNGTPAVIEADDEKRVVATPLHASLDLPLRVELGSVHGPDEHDNLLFDVYLRRTGALSRATTMFVHLVRRPEQPKPPKDLESFFNADHQVVSGSFYLSDSPLGRLVHDAHGVHLKSAARGIWDVYVAFGHFSGQRGRAKVVDAGSATIDADRVRIGSFVVQ